MTQTYVGIDYSMTSPGIAVYHGDAFSFNFDKCKIHYLAPTKKMDLQFRNNLHGTFYDKIVGDYKSEIERFDRLAKWADALIPEGSIVFIEGYSMGSKGKVFNIAENVAVLKYHLYCRGIVPYAIPPTTVKKYIGKGNYDKDQVHSAFVLETGFDIKKLMMPDSKTVKSPVGDIVDAYYVLKSGLAFLNTGMDLLNIKPIEFENLKVK